MNGSKYEFVNAALSGGGGTAINELANVENVLMFPNPANTHGVTVSFNAKKAMDLSVNVTDVIGRTYILPSICLWFRATTCFTTPTENPPAGFTMLSSRKREG